MKPAINKFLPFAAIVFLGVCTLVLILGFFRESLVSQRKRSADLPKISMPIAKLEPTKMPLAKTEAKSKAPEAKFEKKVDVPSAIQEFRNVDSKALRSPEEDAERELLLADRDVLEAAKNLLMTSPESEDTKESRDLRMHTVDYLSEALQWKENPEKEFAVKEVIEILSQPLASLLPPKTGEETRKNFLGDRAELIDILSRTDSKALRRVLANIATEQDMKFFNFAVQTAINQISDEAATRR